MVRGLRGDFHLDKLLEEGLLDSKRLPRIAENLERLQLTATLKAFDAQADGFVGGRPPDPALDGCPERGIGRFGDRPVRGLSGGSRRRGRRDRGARERGRCSWSRRSPSR